jgi:hypothetical protein
VSARRISEGAHEWKEICVIVDMWTYRENVGFDPTAGREVVGFDVEAEDGSIGSIDEATYDVGASYVVLDTGPWIFGKRVMLPAAVIDRVDVDEEKVYVSCTKDQVKNAPELDDPDDPDHRHALGAHYNRNP